MTAGLVRLTAATAGTLGTGSSPRRAADLEAAVVLVVTAAGALAAATITLGCLLLALAAGRSRAGRVAGLLHRGGALLTPAVLRRVLVVGVGLSLVASGAQASDDSGPTDPSGLGWVVTTHLPASASTSTAGAPAVAATPGAPTTAPAPLRHTGAGWAVTPPPPDAGGAPASEPAQAALPAADDAQAGQPVLVRPGDTLWAIARDHLPPTATDGDVAAEWPRWYAANADRIGADPDLILPGQRLVPPSAVPSTTHLEEQS